MISFIVPAHNEELLIGRTLAALNGAAAALGEPSEILVVDDDSTDRTAAVAQECGARVVRVKRRQIAAVRNAGARAATGEVLIFVDADTVAPAATVRAALRALRRGAVGGGCVFRFDGPVPAWAAVTYRLAVPFFTILGVTGGCFLFCTRAGFAAVGGFDESLFAAEEIAFATALKRLGRFAVLRQPVLTSARKLRSHSGLAIAGTLLRLGLFGPKAFRGREGLDVWYGPRPADPGA